MNLHFWLNEEQQNIRVPITATLLDVLREYLGMTGTKRGCEVGECGACTVILNGHAVNSCTVLAIQAQGQKVETVEGLAKDGELSSLQQSFVEEHAVQCGFCTPGMLMSSKALLQENKNPSEEEIRQAISGNLCRCTGYMPIIKAIKKESER
ncbi:(2Fe-2S)-binding protein [Clostridia bacterium]|nr:(2Fe-2S)-binding protein [Clostridia bacterium]